MLTSRWSDLLAMAFPRLFVFAVIAGVPEQAAAQHLNSTHVSRMVRQGIEHGFVKTGDGVRLYYEKAGDGPVLIVPGRLFLFDVLLPLADHYAVISYDMRARGRSDAVTDSSRETIDDDVRDLERIREFFHVDRFTPVGWSYLGLMVVHYATRYPERVLRLVQIGPVPPRFDARYPSELAAGDNDSVPPPRRLAKLDSLQRSGYSAQHPRDYCKRDWAVTRIGLVGRARDTARITLRPCAMPNEWPVNLNRHIDYSIASISKLRFDRQSVSKLTFPVLTVHGTKDRNAPYGGGREWASILPDARLLTVNGAAHAAILERPDVVLPALRTFLGGQWPKEATSVTAYGNAWPQWSPDNQSIVFGSTRDADWEIYVMRADGSGAHRLTYSPGRHAHPSFLPSGRIVFQSPRDHRNERYVDLYTMDSTGLSQRPLVSDSSFNGVPVPSPDGQLVAFQRGFFDSTLKAFHWELFVVDTLGHNERQLTSNVWSSQVPSWMPGGGEIVFYANPDGRNQLYVMDIQSRRPRSLAVSRGDDNAPSVSPDGQFVAFVSDRGGPRDLYVLMVKSGIISRLTTGLEVWSQPSWSRDGLRLLFSGTATGVDEVYIINRDGSALSRVTHGTEGIR